MSVGHLFKTKVTFCRKWNRFKKNHQFEVRLYCVLKRKWHSFYVLIHKSTSYLRFKLYICLIQINHTENSWRDDKCHFFMQYGELLLSHAAVDIFTLYRIIFWITCNIFLFFVCLLHLIFFFFSSSIFYAIKNE